MENHKTSKTKKRRRHACIRCHSIRNHVPPPQRAFVLRRMKAAGRRACFKSARRCAKSRLPDSRPLQKASGTCSASRPGTTGCFWVPFFQQRCCLSFSPGISGEAAALRRQHAPSLRHLPEISASAAWHGCFHTIWPSWKKHSIWI